MRDSGLPFFVARISGPCFKNRDSASSTLIRARHKLYLASVRSRTDVYVIQNADARFINVPHDPEGPSVCCGHERRTRAVAINRRSVYRIDTRSIRGGRAENKAPSFGSGERGGGNYSSCTREGDGSAKRR